MVGPVSIAAENGYAPGAAGRIGSAGFSAYNQKTFFASHAVKCRVTFLVRNQTNRGYCEQRRTAKED
jgi:predicted DNA-binding WGR domain protein